MPRLRNTNTLITDLSQISEGDLIIYHGNLWDAIGTVTILDGAFRLLLDQGQFRPTGWSHFEYYSITNVYINNRQFMKISTQTFDRIQSDQEQYIRVNRRIGGFRTGLFPNA